jgi:hypothetical protein
MVNKHIDLNIKFDTKLYKYIYMVLFVNPWRMTSSYELLNLAIDLVFL